MITLVILTLIVGVIYIFHLYNVHVVQVKKNTEKYIQKLCKENRYLEACDLIDFGKDKFFFKSFYQRQTRYVIKSLKARYMK